MMLKLLNVQEEGRAFRKLLHSCARSDAVMVLPCVSEPPGDDDGARLPPEDSRWIESAARKWLHY